MATSLGRTLTLTLLLTLIDSHGYLTGQDILAALTSMGVDSTEESVKKMIHEVDQEA